MNRSLTYIGCFASLALMLTGCANSTTTPSEPATQPTESTNAAMTEPSPDSTEATATTLQVFAAASLKETFGQLETLFEASHPQVDVSLNLQGSQDLVTAISEGAPADVLATANESTMAKALEASLVGDTQVFATNTLTLITPPGNPAGVTGLDSSLEGAKLVICAPEVPCGKATKKLAEELGLALAPVSEEQKVTDVRGKVASGEADAGVVYKTDAKAQGNEVDVVDIPEADRVINRYPIAVVSASTQTDLAKSFSELVLSEEGQQILKDAGFGQP